MPEVCLLFSKEVLATDENLLHFRARLVAIRFPSGCPYHPALHTNHHTPLIAHTADDIITSLMGVYPERHGQAVSNSFNYFNPNSSDGLGSTFATSFTYWTDVVDPSTPSADATFSLLTPEGKNAPAPWVPFTRAGCNVGTVSIANMELENTGNDILNVFGAGSPEASEAASNFSQATKDFVGISIHCAATSSLCNTPHGSSDILPDEPGGYSGYKALFGHKYVVPVIAPSGLNDLFGNPITGFPGFGGISAAQSLAYTAAMQENGVPVTYFLYLGCTRQPQLPVPGVWTG